MMLANVLLMRIFKFKNLAHLPIVWYDENVTKAVHDQIEELLVLNLFYWN